jgi:hypothetical protein
VLTSSLLFPKEEEEEEGIYLEMPWKGKLCHPDESFDWKNGIVALLEQHGETVGNVFLFLLLSSDECVQILSQLLSGRR